MKQLVSLGLATSVALLAMQQWNWWPYDFANALSLHELTSRYTTEEAPFEEIRARIPNPNHLGVANFSGNNQRDPTETVIWTPMDPMSTFYTIPPERRQLYIKRSAARLRRSGWGVFSPGLEYLPRDLQAGYTIAKTSTVELKGARYIVACFDPRPELALLHVGPTCP